MILEKSFLNLVHHLDRRAKTQTVPFQRLIVRAVNTVLPTPTFGLDIVTAADLLVRFNVYPPPQIRTCAIELREPRLSEMELTSDHFPHAGDLVSGVSSLDSLD